MRKFRLFYITFVLFLSLTGCYVDRGQLENNNLDAENQHQGEQDRVIPSYTTIYEAIENKDLEKAIALLQEALESDKEIDLTQRDGQGRSLLHVAIVDADPSQEVLYVEIVSLLIKLKQDVNARGNHANTLLHIAASKGLFFVAEELIKNGANIYAENEQGEIPLHCAAEEGNIKVVRLLIDQNKIANRTTRLLILTGLYNYIDKKDNHGRTPLYLVMHKLGLCIGNPSFGNPENYIFVVNFLLASGANPHTEDKYGTTLLHLAARVGCVEMVHRLLKEKVEVNLRDEDGNSPLALAISYRVGSPKEKDYMIIVELLIRAGANVNHKNNYNSTPLHSAAGHGNIEIVKLLIAHKVKINFKDDNGYTPFHLAIVNNGGIEPEISDQQRYLEVLDLLIQGGAIIDVKDNDDYTPLQLAVRNGFDKVVIYLIKQGANINPTHNHSLLHDAIYFCYSARKDAYIAIIKYLISLDIGINNVDDKGNSPLHLAIKKLWVPGFKEVVNLLIAAGADIYAVNNKGNTPFFYMKPYIRGILL